MFETLTAIAGGLIQFIFGALHLALLILAVAIGFAILGLIGRAFKKPAAGAARKLGLFKLHETTTFRKVASVKSRLLKEALCKSGADCEEADHEIAPVSEGGAKPLAVLNFDGDLMASQRDAFAHLVDELLVNKDRLDGAIVAVTSPGGGVAQYGQLFAEMERVRKAGLNLTVCVDTVAASGGYLMSVPANKIVSAPFSYVGSIGVVSEFVNVHDFLKRHGFTPMTLTAGKHKRTLTPTGEVTDEAKEYYLEQLRAIHELFIKAVTTYRTKVNPDVACTGAHWTAAESVNQNLGLVDELATSSEYLLKANQSRDLIYISTAKNPFEKGLLRFVTSVLDHVLARVMTRFSGGFPS